MSKQFKEVDPKQNFPQLEEEVLQEWDQNNIFQKSVERNKENDTFVFYEGPPTANGSPGIHHVLTRAFKDVIPRFKSMQGYHVPRKAGWDTHGLPVELQIEKKLEISGKPEIEEYGIEEFNKQCKQSVWEYKTEWENLTKRIGFWLDLDSPYVTYDNNYIESLWWIIKQVHEKGLLYEGYKVVPHCPRCGTALSSHEVAQGYKEVTEPAVFVKLKVKDQENTFLLTWTTTPWTLPGNVGLAVGADFDYVKAQVGEEVFILAKERLEVLDDEYEIIEEFKGSELENLEYEPLFDSLQDVEEKGWYVMPADFVTTDSGTGIVHTAVMYGEDDYELGQKHNLPHTHTVDEQGKFNERVKEFSGMFVKDADKPVADNLKERGLLLKKENYTHTYPFCWRCDTPLLYYAKASWFIKMSSLRKELKENNEQINWVPEHIKEGRFGQWLEGAKDWALSRERYWGTPLPIWKSKSGEVKVIGSIEELKEHATTEINKDDLDLHRPFIDEIKLKDSNGEEMTREVAVLDCWFDSGSMPFAQHHYPFENKELIDSGKQFPAGFISEAIDQTRGWFYTLLAVSTVLEKGPSYKNVICLGHINDKHGKKMSKSKGNVVNPWEVFDKYGVDALRWYLFTINSPGEAKRFDEKGLEEVLKNVILKVWNTYSFFVTYANIDEFSPSLEMTNKEHMLDVWVLGKLEKTKQSVAEKLESYDITNACGDLEVFIDELSNWYIRRSRRRFWKSESDTDKTDAYQTLYYVLLELSKLLAPFMPFMSDALYKGLNGREESVHLDTFPKANEAFIQEGLLKEMDLAKTIVTLGHAARDNKQIKVRQPLSEVLVMTEKLPSEEMQEIIKDELNVKKVNLANDLEGEIKEGVKLNFRVLGKKHGKEMKAIHQAVNNGEYTKQEEKLVLKNGIEILPEEYEKTFESQDENLTVSSEKDIVVLLNTEVTEELKEEGVAREVVRHIQELRKQADYNVDDRISVFVETTDELQAIITKFEQYITEETLAQSIEHKKDSVDSEAEKELEGHKIWLGVKK